jgi:hypothetical protein
MGKLTSVEVSEAVKAGADLEAAITYHFRSNHYPPLPHSLIPVAISIIKGEAGDEIELPDGITWRGQTTAPVSECIRAWHLQDFLE